MFRKYLSAIYVILTIFILIYIYNVNLINEDIKTNSASNTDKDICLDNEFIEINEPIRYLKNNDIQIIKAKSVKSIVYEKNYYDFKERMLDNEEHSSAEIIKKPIRKLLENDLNEDDIQTIRDAKNVEEQLLLIKSIVINDKTYSIKNIESQIKFRDKIKAIRLISKLNIFDLILVIREGITEESLEKVKKQLKKSLSNKEYIEAKELALKYRYLIED